MRILVAIAHHGTKNRPFLERMLDEFRRMRHDVHLVILSEAPKDLGEDVEVIVGLPSPNPWSLPFGHRAIFAERADDFDLFVYSEDDTLITEQHLDAFVELSERLPDNFLPGFMRFEEFPDGERSYSTIHSFYRWDPSSVFTHEGMTFAAFTNEHAACFALTQQQLHQAIRSGGFLVPPHEGRFDMLVSAATDVYTNCGFSKVLCVDRIDDLLVHHMPNVYLNKLGASQEVLDAQIRGIQRVASGELDATELLEPEVRTSPPIWSKGCYVQSTPALLDMVDPAGKRILSIGASTGALEAALVAGGAEVEAVPVDQIFRSVVDDRGILTHDPQVLSTASSTSLGTFDLVLAIDVVQYQQQPVEMLAVLHRLVADGGRVIVGAPDHRLTVWIDRARRRSRPIPSSWSAHGVHRTDPAVLRGWLREAGFRKTRIRHRRGSVADPVGVGGLKGLVVGNRLLADARASV